MTVKIASKIKSAYVKQPKEQQAVKMHEGIIAPPKLKATRYKIKPPVTTAAFYIIISDIVLEDGSVHPFEIFINSKDVEHFQWITALTRVISAIFRKGGDINFLVEELGDVFDPKGGYWEKGKYIPSLPAAIGAVIKEHLGGSETRETREHVRVGAKCNNCGAYAVVKEGGCEKCTSCGEAGECG